MEPVTVRRTTATLRGWATDQETMTTRTDIAPWVQLIALTRSSQSFWLSDPRRYVGGATGPPATITPVIPAPPSLRVALALLPWCLCR